MEQTNLGHIGTTTTNFTATGEESNDKNTTNNTAATEKANSLSSSSSSPMDCHDTSTSTKPPLQQSDGHTQVLDTILKMPPLDEASTSSNSTSTSGNKNHGQYSGALTAGLILFLGAATATAFLAIGISSAIDERKDQFERAATETTAQIESAFEDYVNAVGMVHARCRRRNFSRQDFRDQYEYLSADLPFKAVQFFPNTTHAERPAREAASRAFYAQHYPSIEYKGFTGFNELDGSGGVQVRDEQPFYFPVHWMEPIAGNEAAIDLDYHSSEVRIRAHDAIFENKAPSLSDRLSLVRTAGTVSRCGNHNGPSYGVVLAHPGVELSRTADPDGMFSNLDYDENATQEPEFEYDPAFPDRGFVDDVWPRDIAAMVLCIPDIIARSTINQDKNSVVYIHDWDHPPKEEGARPSPVFMGGAIVKGNGPGVPPNVSFLDETELADVQSPNPRLKLKHQENVTAANRVWTVTVVAMEGDDTYKPNILFVVLGGSLIFLCSLLVSIWVYTNARRTEQMNEMRTKAQAEKAKLILENAQQQAKTERELNDFLAHEVRNPVAAAMGAANFLGIAVNQETPLVTKESRDQAREDLKIIDNALHFVNDLLRNMLDMHRVASKQLQVTMMSTDLLHDVMEPVAGMLHRRGSKIRLILECPKDLIIMTDKLRLKQVILNLGRNSSKFIDVGFIRLQAVVVNGLVRIHVDDSGCGVPKDKQTSLFNKFQESLDVLSQGTGIGLFLCKTLTELMGGEIFLDPDYDSGVPNFPGTRFVVDLKQPPIEGALSMDPEVLKLLNSSHSNRNGSKKNDDGSASNWTAYELPEKLNILFVDDDPILRKLFTRTIKATYPNYVVREAANGETAIRLCEEGEQYDLIFVDMYMASVEKQLLGTETVAELRHRGIKSRVCGLSANDKEEEFFEAGADCFMFKPFPCKKDEIADALCHALFDDQRQGTSGMTIFDS